MEVNGGYENVDIFLSLIFSVWKDGRAHKIPLVTD